MALKFSVYYYRSQTEIVAKLSWNMKMYKTLIKVNMPLGQSILRLELLDVQCRGNLWQDLPCLCPLLISGVKRPNQRSWQVDREPREWHWNLSVYYYRSQTEIVAKLSWNMKMYKALIKVNMPLGQSILRLELLDVQCRGNLWQERPCLCPLLVSGVKRPNQRSWQVDRELQEWQSKLVFLLVHNWDCCKIIMKS